MSNWQNLLDRQYMRADYKMHHAEMLSMANELDAMRQSVNLHDTGAMPGMVYHHIEQAEKGVLAHLFGEAHADTIVQGVIESGESIAHVMKCEREQDEASAYPCGPDCLWTAIYTDHDRCG